MEVAYLHLKFLSLKLSELPIYWDLVKLPVPILVKRLKKRFAQDDDTTVAYDVPSSLRFNSSVHKPELPVFTITEKSKVLLKHYLKDELNALGSGWTSLKNEDMPSGFQRFTYGVFPRKELSPQAIDWNRDQRTGYQFEINGSASRALKKAFTTKGVDVKFSWEFARMQHLPQLALAFYQFPEWQVEVRAKFEEHIQNFAEQCQPGKGIHWTSPMEAAIRLTNVLVAFYWLKAAMKDFEKQVLELAYHHYTYIVNHLEHKDGFGTNHYLSNLMGLVVAGYYLDHEDVKLKSTWAWEEMQRELQKQFFSDGFNFEYSTYYHRLSTEIALLSLNFAVKQSFAISPTTKRIVAKAISSTKDLMKPDGELPKFGDIDSGRIVVLNPDGVMKDGEFIPNFEHCGFIARLKKPGSLYNWFYQDALKTLGSESTNSLQPKTVVNRTKMTLKHTSEWVLNFPTISLGDIKHHFWPNTGLVVFRSDEFYLAVNLMTNPKGHRYRGHSHNDKGSFELQVHGTSYISDPGVLSYTASVELRNQYRFTQAHPVLYTGEEQNRYLEGFLGLFHSCLDTRARVIKMSDHSLECEIFYRRVKVYRRFEIKEDRLIVSDWCNRPFTINKNNAIPLTAGYGKLL